MSLFGYDLRGRGAKRRRPPFRLPRHLSPRDLRIAGVLLYALALWGVMQLPHAAITRWLSSWMD